jgi:hypothetical protein
MSMRNGIAILAAVVVIGAVTVVLQPTRVERSAALQTPASVPIAPATNGATRSEAKLTVDGETYAVQAGATVYDAMKQLGDAGKLSFAGQAYPSLGFFVESINGKKNAADYYWILYVNGISSSLGASAARIHSGDAIEWRYEKGY